MRRLFVFLLALALALPVLPAMAEAAEPVPDAEPTEVIEAAPEANEIVETAPEVTADEIVEADLSEAAIDEEVLDLSEAETPEEYVADLPVTEEVFFSDVAFAFEEDEVGDLVNVSSKYLRFGLRAYYTSDPLIDPYGHLSYTDELDNSGTLKINGPYIFNMTSGNEFGFTNAIIATDLETLTIELTGENNITILADPRPDAPASYNGKIYGIYAPDTNLIFKGNGSLDLTVDGATANCYGIKAKTMTVEDTCSVNITVKGNGAFIDAGIVLGTTYNSEDGILTIDGGTVNVNASDASPDIITFIHGTDTATVNVISGSLTTTTGNSPYYSLALDADNINIADGLPFFFGTSEADAESHTVADYFDLYQPPYDKIPRYVRIGGKSATSTGTTSASSGTTSGASSAPAAAVAPAPAADPAPAAPQILTLNMLKKSAKATVTAAPGTLFQINLGGASGKKFKSSKKSVASVDQAGLLTIKKAGKTKLSVKVGKKTRKLTLTVKDPTVPKSVTLVAPATAVKVGEVVALTPVLPEGTASPIKWKSSNKKVATVSNGVVTFRKAGKVTITATATRGKKKAKVKFTVSK